MANKIFSERLNHELTEIGVPQHSIERVQIFAKLLKLPKFKAESLLNGFVPDDNLLSEIADELEVNKDWLIGKIDKKS